MYSLALLINYATWATWLFRAVSGLLKPNKLSTFLTFSAFFVSFYSISFGVLGMQISMYKMLPLVLILFFFLRKREINIYLLLFITYAVLITAISYISAIYSGGFEFVSNYGRSFVGTYIAPIIQGIFFVSIFLQINTLPKDLQINNIQVLVFYLYGCIALTLIGFLQYGFYFFNISWFDFWFLNDALGRKIEGGLNSHASDKGFYRMSSLGGEPRHFGGVLVLALLLQSYLLNRTSKLPKFIIKYNRPVSILLLSGIVCSMSASSILALVLAFTTYFCFTKRRKLIYSIAVLAALFLIFKDNDFTNALFWKLSSFDMIIYAAKKDGFGLQAIVHNWYYFLFGFGINLADLIVYDYYLIQETPFGLVDRYQNVDPMASSIVPTSAIIQIMLNFGLIGALILLLYLKNLFRDLHGQTKIFLISLLICNCTSSFLIFPIGIFLFTVMLNMDQREKDLGYANKENHSKSNL